MACKENQVEENVSSMLERQIEEYRIELVGHLLTPKEAETIVNFISTDDEDRRIRREHVWRNEYLRSDAYWYLSKLLEKMCQSTPLSIVDEDLVRFSHLVKKVKESFEGAWLDELVEFLHENEKYHKDSVNDLKHIKKHQKKNSEILRHGVKFFTERSRETHAQLQQIKEAKKANCKRCRRSYDGDDGDVLEELERSEQSLRVDLELSGSYIDKLEIRLKDAEANLVEVRKQLKLAPNVRAKLAALEFDIFSPTIIRNNLQDPNLTGGLRKNNGDAGLVKMIPTKPHGEEGSYWS